MLFPYIQRYKRQQRRRQAGRIFFFSTITGILGAVTALFLSNKENREKLSKSAKQAGEVLKENSEKAYKYSSSQAQDIAKKASEAGSNFWKRITTKKQNPEIEIVEVDSDIQ